MYFISDKCQVDEVAGQLLSAGCDLFLFFLVSPYQTRQCSASVHFDPLGLDPPLM